MPASTATLPDGRSFRCVNAYEIDFSWHEIFSDDLTEHGLVLPQDGIYMDVGANIGLFTLYLSDRCSAARVLAYEPIPAAFEALSENIETLGGGVSAYRLALGAAPGEVLFDHYPGISALSTCNPAAGETLAAGIRNLMFGESASDGVREILDRSGAAALGDDKAFVDHLFRIEHVSAPVDTIANQARLHQLSHVDLLKIDTEGAEKDVLAGIDEALWPRIRQLMVEVHIGLDETHAIAADLGSRGYRCSVDTHPMAQGGAPVYHVYATRI